MLRHDAALVLGKLTRVSPGGQPTYRKSLYLGFFLQTEGHLSRVNDVLYDARTRRGDEVARCDEWMRSPIVRPVPAVRSLAISRDPL
jgi:hypothetical protein